MCVCLRAKQGLGSSSFNLKMVVEAEEFHSSQLLHTTLLFTGTWSFSEGTGTGPYLQVCSPLPPYHLPLQFLGYLGTPVYCSRPPSCPLTPELPHKLITCWWRLLVWITPHSLYFPWVGLGAHYLMPSLWTPRQPKNENTRCSLPVPML